MNARRPHYFEELVWTVDAAHTPFRHTDHSVFRVWSNSIMDALAMIPDVNCLRDNTVSGLAELALQLNEIAESLSKTDREECLDLLRDVQEEVQS